MYRQPVDANRALGLVFCGRFSHQAKGNKPFLIETVGRKIEGRG